MQNINKLERALAYKEQELKQLQLEMTERLTRFKMQEQLIIELRKENEALNEGLADSKARLKTAEETQQFQEQQIQKLRETISNRPTDCEIILERNKMHEDNLYLKQQLVALNAALAQLGTEKNILQEELKSHKTPQIVYIKQDKTEIIEGLKARLAELQMTRDNLVKQLAQHQNHISEISHHSSKLQEELDTHRLEASNKYEKLNQLYHESQNMLALRDHQIKELLTTQAAYERERLEYENRIQDKLAEKDHLINNQRAEIETLLGKINQSNHFIIDTVNCLVPTKLDEYLKLKRDFSLLTRERDTLLKQSHDLQQNVRLLEARIERDLPVVEQRKQEHEQLLKHADRQRKQLEQELRNNQQLKQMLARLEESKSELDQGLQLQQLEIERIRSENSQLFNLVEELKLRFLPSTEDSSYFQVPFFQDGNLSTIDSLNRERLALAKQLEQVTQMNRNEITLRAQANSYEELNKKYESSQLKILRLEERIEELESSKALLQQELELKHIIEKPIIPIVHKIEKIKSLSAKQVEVHQELKKKAIQNRRQAYEIKTLQFELERLQQHMELEKKRREFYETNSQRLQQTIDRERHENKNREQQILLKLSEMENNYSPENQEMNYYRQNQQLMKINETNQNLISQHSSEIERLREELHIARSKSIQVEARNGDNEQLMKLRLQLEESQLMARNYEQQLRMLRKNIIETEQKQSILERLEKAARNVAGHKPDPESFENIQEQNEMIQSLNKKIKEMAEHQSKVLEQARVELEKYQAENQLKIKELEQENGRLSQELMRIIKEYEKELVEKESRSQLSQQEVEDLQKKLDFELREKQRIQNLNQKYESEKEAIALAREQLRQDEAQMSEQKKQLQNQYQLAKLKEQSVYTLEHILQRQIDELNEKLLFEQQKFFKGIPSEDKEDKDLTIQQIKEANKSKRHEFDKDAILLQQLTHSLNEAPIIDFEEEKRHYEEQIRQLRVIKDGITIEDVELVRNLVQDGRLVRYLEKAKEIYHASNIN